MTSSTWRQFTTVFCVWMMIVAPTMVGCASGGGGGAGSGGGDAGDGDLSGAGQSEDGDSQTPEEAVESLDRALEDALSEPEQPDTWLDAFVESIGSVYETHSGASATAAATAAMAEHLQTTDDLEQLARASASVAGQYIPLTHQTSEQRRQQGVNGGRIRVIYVNGTNTSFAEAIDQVSALEAALDEVLANVDEVGVFYNLSATETEIDGATFCDVLRLVPFIEDLADLCGAGGNIADIWESSLQVIQEWLTILPTADQVPDLVWVAQTYMDRGDGLIFVTHSQGNLFVSQAIQDLDGYEDSYRVVSVATPIRIEGSALVQMAGDIVVVAVPTAPAPNFDHAPLDDLFCSTNPDVGCAGAYHSFEKSYLLADSEARRRIQEAVEQAAQSLRSEVPPDDGDAAGCPPPIYVEGANEEVRISIEVAPLCPVADGATQVAVTAHVEDSSGGPVVSEQVRFVSGVYGLSPEGEVVGPADELEIGVSYRTLPSGCYGGSNSNLFTTTTDADGEAKATFTLPDWEDYMADKPHNLGVWYHVDGGGNPYASVTFYMAKPE